MKNYLKFLLVFILVLSCVFSFAACNFGTQEEGEGEGTEENNPPQGGGEENPPPVTPPEDDPEPEGYRIRFVYSYTALVVNSNGREDYQDSIVTVNALYVPLDNPVLTAEQIAQIAGFEYNGYTFVEWYSEWDKETQTGITGKEIDFSELGELDGDITVYGDRGNLAGATATWEVEFYDGDGNLIPVADVDANKSGLTISQGILTISGTGKMFDFKNADAVDLPWYNYNNKITQIVIEDGITVIGNNAFSGFTKLKSVTFPDTLTEIGASAFASCTGKAWRSLKTPDSLVKIGNSAFSGTAFKEVVLNEGLLTIGDNAFYDSVSMKSIIVPTTLTSIGIGAFNKSGSTHQLSKVYYLGTAEQYKAMYIAMDNQYFTEFPTTYYFTDDEAVGNTGAYWHFAVDADGAVTANPVQYCYTVNYYLPGEKLPFVSQYIPVSPVIDPVTGDVVTDEDGVAKLEGVITDEILELRNNLTYHNMKFVGFTAKGSAPKELAVGDAITADISYEVQRGNIVSDNGGLIWAYDAGSGTLTISVNPSAPEGASYRMWDFQDAMDTGVLWTGKFNTLKDIKKLVIGDGVEYIGNLAFANLTGITEVILPASVEGVGATAFSGCGALLSIYYMGTDATACEGLLDENGNVLLVETNPSVYIKTETAVAEPGSYWMFVNGDKRLCWTITATETENGYTDGTLFIGGDSVMVDFEHPEFTPWYGAKSFVKSVTFAKNITAIGANVLNGFAAVEHIALPASLRVVPASALEGTGVLTNTANYKNGLLVIDGILLKADPSKMNKELIETYNGIAIIAGGAFSRCTGIKRVYISSTIQYINADAFKDANVEIVYFDGVENGWLAVSADAGFSDETKVYYKATSTPEDGDGNAYWTKVGNDYAIWGCAHKFGDWVVTKDPTCLKEGVETRYCIYDETHTDTRAIPVSTEHNIEGVEFVPYTEATCLSNATEIAYCVLSALGCKGGVIREKEGTQLEHVFRDEDYEYNGDWSCLTPGTMTAKCYLCATVTDTKEDPDYPSIGDHVYDADGDGVDDWVFNNDSTCCEDGTETKTCVNCGDEVTQTALGSKYTTPHNYSKKVEAQKYFAGYEDNGNVLKFFVSCQWCEEKGPYTFSKSISSAHSFEDGTVPSTLTNVKLQTTEQTSGGWGIILEEAVGEVVNHYLKLEKINANYFPEMHSPVTDFAQVQKLVYSFDFKHNYVANMRSDRIAIYFRPKDSKGILLDTNITASADGTTLYWYGVNIKNTDDWINISYEFTKKEDASGYNIEVYIGGNLVKSASCNTAEVPYIFIENRYTSGNTPTDLSYSIDNYIAAAYTVADLSYVTNVCEGEHTMSKYHYNEDGTCTVDGTKSAVCLAEGCNFVETVVDEDHRAHGHVWSEDETDGYVLVDATCTADGYYTRTCIVCGEVDAPLYDKDNDGEIDHPMLTHVWADATEENPDGYVIVDATCSAEGYYTRTCTICELVEKEYDRDGNEGNDFPVVEDAHAWADATEENPEGYVTVDATCTDDGYSKRVCTLCETVETVYDLNNDGETDYPKLGHAWADATEENPEGYVTVDATCSAEGYYIRTCTVCELVEKEYDLDGNEGNDFPVVEDAHVWADATEENLEGYVIVDATCTEDGYSKRVCTLCETVETVYDLDNDGETDYPKLGHAWADATEDNLEGYVTVDATCTDDGYFTRTCSECDVVETVYDLDEDGANDIPAPGHTFVDYYYNGDRDCDTDGTETAYCELCDATDTRVKAGYEKLGHLLRPSDYKVVPGSATCQHGSETSAACSRAGCDFVDATYADDILTYHSFIEVADDKYFAGYINDLTEITYYESCEWCGAKAPSTFAQTLLTPDIDDLSDGTIPSYILPQTSIVNRSEIPTTSGKYCAIINNSYYATGKVNSGGEVFNRFNLVGTDGTTEVLQFEFKFDGATYKDGKSGEWFGIVKFFGVDGKTEVIGNRAMNFADVDAQKMKWEGNGGNIFYKGEWHTIRYEVTHSGGKSTLVTIVDGTVISTATSSAALKTIAIHTRSDTYYTSVHFGYRNFYKLTMDPNAYTLETVNCADGEHNMGWWIYNNDGNCVNDGTRTAICQNGTCNYTVTELDPDHAATGQHNLTDWTYNEDQSCEKNGTLTQHCKDCDYSETKVDAENYPALGHAYGEFTVVPDSANCQHGTISRKVCANGCGIDIVEYGEDVGGHVAVENPAMTALKSPATHTAKATYYKTCSVCSALIADETFEYGELLADAFANGELYATTVVHNFNSSDKNKASIVSEEVAGVVNYFLRSEKASTNSQNFVRLTTDYVEGVNTYAYEFDFRWGGTTRQAAKGAMMIKAMKNLKTTGDSDRLQFLEYGNSADVGADLTIGAATVTKGEWTHVTVIMSADDNSNWTCKMYVGDTLAFTVVCGYLATVPIFMLESRYGAYDMFFDVDNVVAYPVITVEN